MAEYTDFQFKQGEYGVAAEYVDDDAIILAIQKSSFLSRPGNFPLIHH